MEQSFSFNEKSDIIIVYRPVSQKKESLPDLFAATFPYTEREDLKALSNGDYIEFEGELSVHRSGASLSPSVINCVLLKHEIPKKPK